MKNASNTWSVAQAKQRLSELLRAANEEPQVILNRGHPVAAVIDSADFEQFRAWQGAHAARSVADVFAEVRALASAESYALEVPERVDRSAGWVDDDAAVPGRHQHPQ